MRLKLTGLCGLCFLLWLQLGATPHGFPIAIADCQEVAVCVSVSAPLAGDPLESVGPCRLTETINQGERPSLLLHDGFSGVRSDSVVLFKADDSTRGVNLDLDAFHLKDRSGDSVFGMLNKRLHRDPLLKVIKLLVHSAQANDGANQENNERLHMAAFSVRPQEGNSK